MVVRQWLGGKLWGVQDTATCGGAACCERTASLTVWLAMIGYGAAMRIVEKAQLMSASEIDRTLQRLAHEIVEKSGGTKHLALIGIRRRGVPLAQRIAQAMRGIDGVDVPVGTLDITLYRDDLSKVASHAVLQSSDISFGVDNMDLVLVDDVLYTGRTIRAAMNGLFDLGRPKRVSLCVLIDRGHREMPIEAQFTGRVRADQRLRKLSKCGCARSTTKSASCWSTV